MVRPNIAALSLVTAAMAGAVPARGHGQLSTETLHLDKREFEDSKSPEQKRKAKEISEATMAESGKENPKVVQMVQDEEAMLSEEQRERGKAIVDAIMKLSRASQRG
ncbi:hypothetical protein CDD83_10518 [Cordyceps sp. RAO-2017]|nr:hypothetical protein CDD83_10518 [Cordyceps sp. RAO-2017]